MLSFHPSIHPSIQCLGLEHLKPYEPQWLILWQVGPQEVSKQIMVYSIIRTKFSISIINSVIVYY